MSLSQNNLICRCFYAENYFIKRLKLHVRFCGRCQFMQTYGHVRIYDTNTVGGMQEIGNWSSGEVYTVYCTT